VSKYLKLPKENPLLSRRNVIKAAGFTLASLSLVGCGGELFEDKISKLTEPLNQTLEEALFNKYKLSTFSKSAIEPKALIVNTAEEEVPAIDADKFELSIGGKIDHPIRISLKELRSMPYVSIIIRHVCVEGWAAIVQWGGVQLSYLAKLVGAKAAVRFAYFGSVGDTYYESWDIASVMHPQTILAYEKNFAPLPAENGGPLRLASPIKLGYKLSKWVNSVNFLTVLPEKRGYWEDQGYEWYAGL
jgi:DMSO/TMAO reductase YedYZ molybdopterin-dependent catalytic subunit